MTYQPFFQLIGTLIATLLVALVVTGRFLAGHRGEGRSWLSLYRAVSALLGVLAAVYGESQVLKALLSNSPGSLVTRASAGLGVLSAALIANLLSEAWESLFGPRPRTLEWRWLLGLLATASSAAAGTAWTFYIRR